MGKNNNNKIVPKFYNLWAGKRFLSTRYLACVQTYAHRHEPVPRPYNLSLATANFFPHLFYLPTMWGKNQTVKYWLPLRV